MNRILLSSLAALVSASVTLSVSAKEAEDKLRQGRSSSQSPSTQSMVIQSEQKNSSSQQRGSAAHGHQNQTASKHQGHSSSQYSSGHHNSSHHNEHRYDPAKEMRQALKHLWKEHRYQDSYGRRKRNNNHHAHSSNTRSKGKHSNSSRSYNASVSRFTNDPHFVRYYDNDFYVYLNDRYYQDHFRGPWWGHYHRGDYCRTKHNYLMHDDVRNLLMLGLVIDLVNY